MNILRTIKRNLPTGLLNAIRPGYHFFLAWLSSIWYSQPSKDITVIGVTGTKGKTTVTELLFHLFRKADVPVAVSNGIHFQIKDNNTRNKRKMSMPGRFFLQSFLYQAKEAGCEIAVIEMTSEGAKQYRHRFIHMDTLVWTNLTPEHIEAHGSFAAYRQAKLNIAKQLDRSNKSPARLIVNADDDQAEWFLDMPADKHITYQLEDAKPLSSSASGSTVTIEDEQIQTKLFGEFNVYNILAAAKTARVHGLSWEQVRAGLETFSGVPGRLQAIDAGQEFGVYVDYAHTPDSLKKVYETFGNHPKVCILGAAGGGRDTWKRKKMAKLAEKHCRKIVLTDEDPYDEDPQKIVDEMAKAITIPKYEIVMDRRKAIRRAFDIARPQDVVLLTGKGTDPYIMRANGEKQPWNEADIAREELERMQGNSVNVNSETDSKK